MDGVHVAFDGRLGQDAELKFTSTGTMLVSFSVLVQDSKSTEPQWVRCGKFGDEDAEELARQLVKGTEVYIEGRQKMKTWQGADGSQRAGLDVTAWEIKILGRIGRRAPWRGRVDQHGDTPRLMPQSMALGGGGDAA